MRLSSLVIISAMPLIAAGSLNASAFKTRPSYERAGSQFSTPVLTLPTVRSADWVVSPRTSSQSSDTANLYRVNCQMCHGPAGKALIPEMAFVGRKWKHGTKSVEMAKIISEGVIGTPMLPFKSKLTAVQIRALAKYVRAFDKTLAPEK